MKEALLQLWRSRDLRAKILYTLGILVFIRFVAHIPLPEIDRDQLAAFLAQSENQVLGFFSLFTGGSLTRLSVDLLGVGPYITASIIVQLLTKAIPAWDEISKEGNSGREKLNQYTRYLVVPMALVQGYAMIVLLKSQNVLTLVTPEDVVKILLTVTATSVFVTWLGELISEKGIGNGISLIIALGIVAGLPQQVANTANVVEAGNIIPLVVFAAVALLVVAVIVLVTEAERKVPITHTRRAVGAGSAVDSYLPLRLNSAGVIPIIFALSFLTFPQVIARFLTTASSPTLVSLAGKITEFSTNNLYYGISYFLLVFAFTFFYTYIVFQPDQVSDNLQKQGSFIPGVRPGRETVTFLRFTISRITLIGATFLGIIAVLPIMLQGAFNVPTLVIGGTSVLIVVSVVIETSRQVGSQLLMRRYESAG
ncbi:MAG: preprotein translocase subunit SecY [Patescibacteria group bacterium]